MIVLAIPSLLHHKYRNSQITDISENDLLKYPKMLSSLTVSFTPGACSPLQGAAPGFLADVGGFIPTLQIGK